MMPTTGFPIVMSECTFSAVGSAKASDSSFEEQVSLAPVLPLRRTRKLRSVCKSVAHEPRQSNPRSRARAPWTALSTAATSVREATSKERVAATRGGGGEGSGADFLIVGALG